MQRLIIEKNEAVADLIERILETQDEELVLIVPKGSRLTDSKSNFKLIAREAKVLSKDILIESVDEEVLVLAAEAGLRTNHPLFSNGAKAAAATVSGAGKSFSDIVSRSAKDKDNGKSVAKKLKVRTVEEPEEDEEEEEETGPDEAVAAAGSVAAHAEAGDEMEAEAYDDDEDTQDASRRDEDAEEERYDTLEEPRRGGRRKLIAWVAGILIVAGAAMWITAAAFGKATLDITFQKAPWDYSGNVTAAVTVKDIDVNGLNLPAELIEQQQTLPPQFFPATGRATGGQKAHTMITIVNEHGAEPQELVATTRFLTPDGKLFRLDSGVVVPGATVDAAGSVTEPGRIKAAATADQPGPDHNIGPVPRLTIPGFQGTAKYEGFYGVIEEGASGGSTSGGLVASEEDVASAREQVASRLDDSMRSSFLTGLPPDLTILPEASRLATTTFSVNTAVDEQGRFSVGASTVFRAFGFREEDLRSLLNARASQADPGKELQNLVLQYAEVTPDFDAKELTFRLTATAELAPKFDKDAFGASVSGLSQDEARRAILALPELEDAKVSLWPAWLFRIPEDPSKVTVNVN